MNLKLHKPLCIFDLETTGTNIGRDRIVEICILKVNPDSSRESKTWRVNPEMPIPPHSTAIHGISDEMLADKPKFKQIAKDFLGFIQGSTLIIHNASFDIGFLDGELERLGLGKTADYVEGVIDSLGMAREMFPGKRNNLDALCDRLGVNNAHRQLHGALLDSQILAEVYLAMTRGQDSLVIDLNAHHDDDGVERIKLGSLNLPEPEPSEEEMALHLAYLEDIEKAAKGPSVWSKISQPTEESAV